MEKISATKNFVGGMEDLIPTVNDSPYKRILAVGDVHGCFRKLTSLLEKVCPTDDDLVIFLGDYIDRGNEVAETLKWVLTQSNRENFTFLRGNHEQMMLDVLHGRLDKLSWFFNGGQTTISGLSELKAEDETFIERVLNFAENLPLYHAMTIGGREYVFVHAGIKSGVELDEQAEDFLLWSREEFFDCYDGDAVVIGGHSLVQAFRAFGVADDPRPLRLPRKNIVMIDTGSFIRGSGKISCVNILSGEFWQSDVD